MNVFINSSVNTNPPVNILNLINIEKGFGPLPAPYGYVQVKNSPRIKFTTEDGDIFYWYFTTEAQRNADYSMLMSQMQPVGTGGGGGGSWGSITGDINAQTDLNNTFAKSTIKYYAAEDISSGMVVVMGVDGMIYKYNTSNINHVGLTCGIAKNAALASEEISITIAGNVHVEVGSGWEAGKSYFISSASSLSTVAPSSGISKKIATGLATDTVLVNDYPELVKLNTILT